MPQPPRKPEKTTSFSNDELRSLAERIRVVATRLETLAQQSGKEKWLFRRTSLETAVNRLESFDRDLKRSLHLALIKKPLGPESSKEDLT